MDPKSVRKIILWFKVQLLNEFQELRQKEFCFKGSPRITPHLDGAVSLGYSV